MSTSTVYWILERLREGTALLSGAFAMMLAWKNTSCIARLGLEV